jgi:hypothetical protein
LIKYAQTVWLMWLLLPSAAEAIGEVT